MGMGIHILELKPGVSAGEFEKFAQEELSGYFHKTPGLTHHVYKGIKGDRTDKYLLVFKFEGNEALEHFYSSDEEKSEVYKQENEENPDNIKLAEKLMSMVSGFTIDFTDYIKID
jgi:heme-degrading monooxygenase HmoA